MHTPRPRRAFTLLELLMVIGIIGVLIAVTLAVGTAVTSGARTRLTQDTIRVLDTSLQSYIASAGDAPPPTVADPRPGQTEVVLVVADARNFSEDDTSNPNVAQRGKQMIDSVGLYILQANKLPSAKAVIERIPSKQLVLRTTKTGGANLTLTTVLDAWGRPIRYVHPAFHGVREQESNLDDPRWFAGLPGLKSPYRFAFAQIRRNNKTLATQTSAESMADGDGGSCVGGRPYFYSAGPDGDPSTIADNVYTTTPNFAPLTP